MSFYRNLNYLRNERKSEKKSEKKMAWIVQCIKQGMPEDKIMDNLKGTGLTKKMVLKAIEDRKPRKQIREYLS